jgi:hypothetical protein
MEAIHKQANNKVQYSEGGSKDSKQIFNNINQGIK